MPSPWKGHQILSAIAVWICVTAGSSTALPSSAGGSCRVPLDEAGLLWDGICLAFLLMQKRLFTSYYFHHLIIEILAQQQLASRGAEMIHEIQMKDVQVSSGKHKVYAVCTAVCLSSSEDSSVLCAVQYTIFVMAMSHLCGAPMAKKIAPCFAMPGMMGVHMKWGVPSHAVGKGGCSGTAAFALVCLKKIAFKHQIECSVVFI